MRAHSFDHLLTVDSPVRRLNASVKGITALVILLTIACIPIGRPDYLAAPLVILGAIVVVSRLPLLFLFRRILLLEPFAVAAASLALFHPAGWVAFVTVLAKSTLSLLAIILLSATTPFTELIALLRLIGLPSLLVVTITLLYRYLFLLADQADRMKTAREARTMKPGKRRIWFLHGGIIGSLVVRSMDRADGVYSAMRARGWS
jgi:cobalt/nickel transport system permease protein